MSAPTRSEFLNAALEQAEGEPAISIPFGDGSTLVIGNHEGRVLVQLSPGARPDGSMPEVVNLTLNTEMAEVSGRLILAYAERLGRPDGRSPNSMN